MGSTSSDRCRGAFPVPGGARAGPAPRGGPGRTACTGGQGWLFSQLGKEGSPLAGDERLNLAAMSVRKDLLTREFVRFLRSLGPVGEDLVLVDTGALDPRGHDWFLHLTRRFLDYRTVVPFTGRTP